jgi:hypothetical protein
MPGPISRSTTHSSRMPTGSKAAPNQEARVNKKNVPPAVSTPRKLTGTIFHADTFETGKNKR